VGKAITEYLISIEKPISEVAIEAIHAKVFPGCVIGVVHARGERQILPYGNFTYDLDSPVVKENTIYDVASITKSIPTAGLALQLIDQGKLKLTDKLIDYVPEFRNSDRELVTIRHLLTYTLDSKGLAYLKDKSAAEVFEVILTRDFENRPGTVFKYTNIAATLLGFVVEKIFGDTLDQLADGHFFKPLNMNRTTFYPERFPKAEIVPTEIDDWRGIVQGVVHDESAYACKQDGKIIGHAGLFSTAPDLLNFLEMLLNQGTFNGRRYFTEETVRQMGTNQIPELGDSTGLGWELNQPSYMGRYCTEHTFGKTGFTGTLAVCDVAKGIGYVILTNRIYPKRPADSAAINAFRKSIGEILLQP
jgi:CubicO group peptidase (beta-lactamase class C family)